MEEYENLLELCEHFFREYLFPYYERGAVDENYIQLTDTDHLIVLSSAYIIRIRSNDRERSHYVEIAR